jgi:hypothetical protein
MLKRQDKYVLNLTFNTHENEMDVAIKRELTLAELQDMIGSIVENTPTATSFMFTVVRVTHTNEEQERECQSIQ